MRLATLNECNSFQARRGQTSHGHVTTVWLFINSVRSTFQFSCYLFH